MDLGQRSCIIDDMGFWNNDPESVSVNMLFFSCNNNSVVCYHKEITWNSIFYWGAGRTGGDS